MDSRIFIFTRILGRRFVNPQNPEDSFQQPKKTKFCGANSLSCSKQQEISMEITSFLCLDHHLKRKKQEGLDMQHLPGLELRKQNGS